MLTHVIPARAGIRLLGETARTGETAACAGVTRREARHG
jgi:hypothetical protein